MIIADNNCLYHFCNLDAFQSIAKNKEFWLSETKTMNDATELQWFASNIKPILVEHYEKQPNLIDEVVVGPKCQAPPNFISAILKSNGFVNAKVRKSDGFDIYR